MHTPSDGEAERMLESIHDLFLQKQKAETVSFEKKPDEAIFKKPKNFRRLSKKDISTPCNFKHVSGKTECKCYDNRISVHLLVLYIELVIFVHNATLHAVACVSVIVTSLWFANVHVFSVHYTHVYIFVHVHVQVVQCTLYMYMYK